MSGCDHTPASLAPRRTCRPRSAQSRPLASMDTRVSPKPRPPSSPSPCPSKCRHRPGDAGSDGPSVPTAATHQLALRAEAWGAPQLEPLPWVRSRHPAHKIDRLCSQHRPWPELWAQTPLPAAPVRPGVACGLLPLGQPGDGPSPTPSPTGHCGRRPEAPPGGPTRPSRETRATRASHPPAASIG